VGNADKRRALLPIRNPTENNFITNDEAALPEMNDYGGNGSDLRLHRTAKVSTTLLQRGLRSPCRLPKLFGDSAFTVIFDAGYYNHLEMANHHIST
jgi:hypothetical protein